MSKLNWNYNDTKKGATEEGFVNLTAGPKLVKILDVKDVDEKQYLKISFDIAEGNLKDHFKDQYVRFGGDWPSQATLYKSYKDSAKYFFAGFLTALEKSNDGFIFNPDDDWEKQLKGKVFVANFGEQEYISNDMDANDKFIVKTILKCQETRSTQALKDGDIDLPSLKKLSKNDFDYKGITEKDISRDVESDKEDNEFPF